MTEAEKILWLRLRRKQLKNRQFYRQRIIGNCIVDFYCPKEKLIVEVDGGQHYSKEGIQKDKIRESYLKDMGMRILRFSDRDIFANLNGVIERIFEYL